MFDNPTQISPTIHSRGFGTVKYGTGATPAEFFHKAVYMAAESERHGKPIYKSFPYIRFFMVGGATIEKKVTDEHKHQYPREWANFEVSGESGISGTPLEQWPVITVDLVATLRHLGIRTVEQLAGSPDTGIQGVMGGWELRTKAQNFLRAAESSAPLEELSAENAKLKEEIEALKGQMKAISTQMANSSVVGAEEHKKSKTKVIRTAEEEIESKFNTVE